MSAPSPGAENRAADRLAREGGRLQVLEHEVVGGILDGADLLDDDVLFAVDLVGVEARMRQDVGEHVEPERDVGLEHARVIGRHLDPGAGIEVAADRLDFLGDLAGGAPRRALERHVLEKMRNAVLVGAFAAAAAGRPRRRAKRSADAASLR